MRVIATLVVVALVAFAANGVDAGSGLANSTHRGAQYDQWLAGVAAQQPLPESEPAATVQTRYTIDEGARDLPFLGYGVNPSAGTYRLLHDYPEAQRAEILVSTCM